MTYQVLARKYRPQDFSQVAGQQHVVRALSNALEQGRLHHAYLFTGTRGIGKTTISRILAKALNCTGVDGRGGITSRPCGQCPSCQAINAGHFVDYTELDAASNRGVDEVQGLLEQAVYKPVQGRFKVFMIDEVHMLSNTAFNAMLKTLEEPPEYLKFVLATTDPQKIPVTVLSRCLQFNLRPMAPEVIAAELQKILQREDISCEPSGLRMLARAARGSMRDALSLADQAIAYGSGQLQAAGIREMLGGSDQQQVHALIAALAAADGAAVMAQVDQLRKTGQSAAGLLSDMAELLQRMAVCQLAEPGAAGSTGPDESGVHELAGQLAADETQLLYSLCIHGAQELPLAPDEYVGLTMALLRFLPFRDAPPAGPAAQKKSTEPALTSVVSARSDPEAAEPALQPDLGEAAPASGSQAQAPAARVAAPAAHAELLPAPSSPAGQADAADAMAAVAPGPTSAAEPAQALESGDAQASGQPQARTASDEAAPRAALADFWCHLVAELVAAGQVQALPRELALQSQLVDRAGGQWTLLVAAQSLADDALARRLQEALRASGQPVDGLQVQCGAVTDTAAMRARELAHQRQQLAERTVHEDPYVQRLLQHWDARIVPDSIRPL